MTIDATDNIDIQILAEAIRDEATAAWDAHSIRSSYYLGADSRTFASALSRMAAMPDEDENSGFSVLDENGRLFGLVNVVDLLVVLLVLAVVVAGGALLLGGAAGEPDTRYATVDLGAQSEFVAEQISPGDQFEPQGTGHSLTITDVYRFEQAGETHVLVRTRVNGTTIEPDDPDDQPVFEYRGDPLRLGRPLAIQTPDYAVEGATTQVERSGNSLPVQQSEFVIDVTLSSSTAEAIAIGDQFRAGGDAVAEITAVQQFPGSDQDRSALIGLSARTIEQGGTQRFAGQPLRIGRTVPFSADGYSLAGEIIRRGTSTIDTQQRPFVVETTVPATVAEDITAGDEFRFNDETLVTVESVTVYTTGNPDNRDVVLGVSITTREEDGTVLFGDRPLRIGSTVPIETAEYDIAGEIIRRDSLDAPGEPATRTVTLGLDNIRPERAAVIQTGLTEQTRGQTTAEIVSKTTEPADIVLESETGDIFLRQHPKNLDVELTVELGVRELEDGTVRFRGDALRTGETLTLDFGGVRIQGELFSIQG